VEELDVKAVRVEAGDLRDSVSLLEAQHELVAEVDSLVGRRSGIDTQSRHGGGVPS